MTVVEAVIQKIQKLMRHEGSARHIGNLAEAEAFASKSQELMLRHRLEMSDVEAAELAEHEPIEDVMTPTCMLVNDRTLTRNRKEAWIGIMLVGLAKANFCYVIASSRMNAYHVIGRRSDRETFTAMAQYLYTACNEVVETEVTKFRQSLQFERAVTWHKPASVLLKFRASFKRGFASAIATRLKDERTVLLNAVNEEGLIRLDGVRAEVQQFVKKGYPSLRFSSVARASSALGYNAGHDYGSSVGLSKSKRLSA